MANGWPDKPGVPVNPAVDGEHWVRWTEQPKSQPFLVYWNSDGFWLYAETDYTPSRYIVTRWTYLEPVLTPDEVTARIAAAIAAEREACANVVSDWPIKYDGRPYTVMDIQERDERIAAAIRVRNKSKEN